MFYLFSSLAKVDQLTAEYTIEASKAINSFHVQELFLTSNKIYLFFAYLQNIINSTQNE